MHEIFPAPNYKSSRPSPGAAMVQNQQLLAEWLSQPPHHIIARGRNVYN